MVWRSIVACKLRRRRSVLRYRQFNPIYIVRSHSASPLSQPSSKHFDPLSRLNHRDWLAPNEVLQIFQTLKDSKLTLDVLHKLAKRKDYRPNEALYTLVIQKLAQAKMFDEIDDILKRIKTEKIRLSDDFFYVVIKIYGNVACRINRAIQTLFGMPEFNCWPTVRTFNFVLNLLVLNRQYDVIHEVYMGATQLGIEIDACCLNILIKGLCQRGDIDAAFKVLDEFPRQGHRPNIQTFSTLIHGLCKHKRLSEAFELFEKMEKAGVDPDAITFNILISGLRKQRRFEEAVNLFSKMGHKGCDPNPGTHQEVLYALLDAEKFSEAKSFLDRMVSMGLNPSFVSYKLIIQGLCSSRKTGDVEIVLRQMLRQGFVPGMGMWRLILEGTLSGTSSDDYISFNRILDNPNTK
ncbi:Pentatricopeptide repeat [Dillenia turbinata]|uniref:Pentatricopeptide repeat n=1 Tax=Dillenia turbinata TaxID=194707 RepID=A0AAN8W7B2_9MAGN